MRRFRAHLCLLFVTLLAAGVAGQEVSHAASYQTVTAAAMGTRIAAIQGPRSGTGNQANLAKLNEVADYVHGQLLADGLAVSEDPVTFGGQTFPNIVGSLAGTTCPEKTFIIGAHYDGSSAGPAADDNASGVAGMLEIAQALTSQPLPASVDFAAFSFEEAGLIGSGQMAQAAAISGRDIVGMFSLEMIGYTCDEPGCQNYPAGLEPPRETGDFLSIIGNTASDALLNRFIESSAEAVPDLIVFPLEVSGKGESMPDVRRSDHAPFWDNGFQALLVSDTADLRNPNYHQPMDTLDTLDLQFAANVTNASLATVVRALTADANGDGRADVCGEAPAVGGSAESPQPGQPVHSEAGGSSSDGAFVLALLAATGVAAIGVGAGWYALKRKSH